MEKKSQQSFMFEKKDTSIEAKIKTKFKLPSIDLLKKSTSKINVMDLNKNRPDSKIFMLLLFLEAARKKQAQMNS